MPPRAIILEIVRGVWLAMGIVWVIGRFNTKPAAWRQSRRSLALYGALLMLSLLLLAGSLPVPDARLLTRRPELIGLALVLAGAGLAIWSRLVLARNWSGAVELKAEHELITRGPYGVVRHPIYSGALLMFLGTALVRGTVQAFAAVALFLVVHLWKLRAEEAALARHFSGDFAAYQQRTKALVPFVF